MGQERADAPDLPAGAGGGEGFVGKQALTYAVGISDESVGARGSKLQMQLVRIPPARAISMPTKRLRSMR